MQHILVALGTRPEVIKLAPVIQALRARPDVRTTLCSTGQHRDMLDTALAAFDLHADLDLKLMQPGQHPTEFFGRLLLALHPVLAELRPDAIVVQGDTTTVAAAALAGFMSHVRVAHVEAGLRTADKRAPFPEEVNRRVAGVVADWHFAPTAGARENLLREGVPPETVFLTGNTVVDALDWMVERVRSRPLPKALAPRAPRLILVTAHRRESFGEPFRHLCHALRELAERFGDVELIYPVHLNPNVRQPVYELLGNHSRIRLIDPLGYTDFVALLSRAHLIITDSGGIQEEAPGLGIPALVLRDKTERPEAVAAGVVQLVGTDRDRIVHAASRLLEDEQAYRAMARRTPVYGDGRAAQRIVEVLTTGQMVTPAFCPPTAS